jgi:hypothetical protein
VKQITCRIVEAGFCASRRSAPLANVTSVDEKQLNFGNGSADPPPKASDHCFWGFFCANGRPSPAMVASQPKQFHYR